MINNFMFSQDFRICGNVYDQQSREPLSFVNIVVNNSNRGGISDIDGRFCINSSEEPINLKLSYVGYEPVEIQLENLRDLRVFMKPSEITLAEVVILPGENPAHRIIDSVIANRQFNRPENLPSFEYKAHNKVSFGIDSVQLNQLAVSDTGINSDALRELQKTYILLIESITSRKYMYPENNQEEILAYRISGFNDPYLSLLASQLQTFSFYDEYISILDKRYLNPISTGSTDRYFFNLEDTTYNQSDTVFIISYQPRRNRNFDALKGLLYINTNGYAIQNVTAGPAEGNAGAFEINIRQAYEQIEGKYWFPVQLNTELTYKYPDAINLKIFGNGRSYLTEIVVNGQMRRRDFGHIALEISDDAFEKNDDFWARYRYEPLTEKDIETYRLIDSLSRNLHFDRMANLLKTITLGKIPYKIFDIQIDKIVNYNNYSGWRFGLGLETNHRLSRLFSLNGYGAYALKNDYFLYGAGGRIHISPRNDIYLNYNFQNDDLESAPIHDFKQVNNLSLNDYRRFLISRTDHTRSHLISFTARPYKYLSAAIAYKYSEISPNFDYRFVSSNDNVNILRNDFIFSEMCLKLRYAHKESFVYTEGLKMSMGTKYPVIYFGIRQGLDNFNGGEFAYTRFDFEADSKLYLKMLGESRLIINAGYISGTLPYSKLYNGIGSYDKFTVYSPFTFSTMRLNEMLSEQYIALFYQHSFGSLLLKSKKFNPEFVIVQNFMIGQMKHATAHRNIAFTIPTKGFYESGFVIDNLLKSSIVGMGVGAFYRYGPYSFGSFKENISVQMSFKFTS
ncbi:MAG: DUF5686 family protein [Bacteroidales bacterium]|nr:DUF5686 family protein [Bacteroidales bacterium]